MSVADVVRAGDATLKPIDRRPLAEWAPGNVVFPPGSPYALTGPFSTDTTRHWIDPLNALSNDFVRDVLVKAPPRSGKNVVADVWLPSVVRRDPGTFQWLCSTDKIRDDYKADRLDKVLEASPATRDLMPAGIYKDTKRKITFAHGMPFYIEGPSDANLQTKGIRFQVRDEAWLWEAKLKEADARLGDFDEYETAKALTITQGGEADGPLDALEQECVFHEWTVQCQFCGAFFVPAITTPAKNAGNRKRFGFVWDEDGARDKLNDWRIDKVLESLRYEPECCGEPHIDSPRLKANWNRTGKYRKTQPGNPRKSAFHIYATPLKKWEYIASNLVAAHNARRRGNIDLLKQFTQKEEANQWNERALAAVRAVVIQTEPKEDIAGSLRIATVDVQAEHLWYLARCWEPGGKSRRLQFAKLFSWAEVDAANAQNSVDANLCFVDSGYNTKGDTGVYSACCDYGWIPTKGDEKEFFLWPIKKKGRVVGHVQKSYAPPVLVDSERGREAAGNQAAMCYMIRYSTTATNAKLDGLIKRGFWTEPEADEGDKLEAQYSRQMQSTILVQARGKFVWKTIDNENHAWDLSTMQVLAAILREILPDEYALQGESNE